MSMPPNEWDMTSYFEKIDLIFDFGPVVENKASGNTVASLN